MMCYFSAFAVFGRQQASRSAGRAGMYRRPGTVCARIGASHSLSRRKIKIKTVLGGPARCCQRQTGPENSAGALFGRTHSVQRSSVERRSERNLWVIFRYVSSLIGLNLM